MTGNGSRPLAEMSIKPGTVEERAMARIQGKADPGGPDVPAPDDPKGPEDVPIPEASYRAALDVIEEQRSTLQRADRDRLRAKDRAAGRLATLNLNRAVMISTLGIYATEADWHGVADMANDLRELDAEIRGIMFAAGER